MARRYDVLFTPDVESKHAVYAIRDVDSQKIGHYVTIRGIITRVGEMLPMVRIAAYECRQCHQECFQRVSSPFLPYQQIVRRSFTPLKVCPSEVCKRNHSNGDLVMKLSNFKWARYQEVILQECSDQIPAGHIPRVLTVQLRDSVTQSCVPGDIVSLSGEFDGGVSSQAVSFLRPIQA